MKYINIVLHILGLLAICLAVTYNVGGGVENDILVSLFGNSQQIEFAYKVAIGVIIVDLAFSYFYRKGERSSDQQ